MCSRYSFTSPPEAVRRLFAYPQQPNFPPGDNIAPSQPVPVIRLDHNGEREFLLVRWGLVPAWVKDPRKFTTLINARSETVFEKPSFRAAITHRRCLVPANGFYEWTGARGHKTPHYIRRHDGGLIAFAGLWETWLGIDGSEFDSMAILTTQANATMEPIHGRMPVIVPQEHHAAWLDVRETEKADVAALLRPAPDDLLVVEPVTWSLSHKKQSGTPTPPPGQGALFQNC